MATVPKLLKHPYHQQPDKAFWKRTVGEYNPLDIISWYTKKFTISDLPIATAGSCFAQHIGKQLKRKGFNFVDVEPPPPILREDDYHDYGYGMYSARYGNIYNSRQLLQLLQRAVGQFVPNEKFWIKDDGYIDPYRPTIEPNPYISLTELDNHRDYHLQCVRALFEKADVFIYTLGLTEAWVSIHDGAVFPVAPGVNGGIYDSGQYRLLNLTYAAVINDMQAFFNLSKSINKKLRFILTVSPVPLMATATAQQVVVATMYSKSVLRAAAGFLASKHKFVDYFPSYLTRSFHRRSCEGSSTTQI